MRINQAQLADVYSVYMDLVSNPDTALFRSAGCIESPARLTVTRSKLSFFKEQPLTVRVSITINFGNNIVQDVPTLYRTIRRRTVREVADQP